MDGVKSDAALFVEKLPSGEDLLIETWPDVFQPTHTTTLCIKAAWKEGWGHPKRVLDLGCGCGIVGLAMHKMGLVRDTLFASDLSIRAVELTRRNAERLHLPVDARSGSLFEPWKGMRFDCILDDVSGVAEDVARLSPWFGDKVPCCSDLDGAALTLAILGQAADHLENSGVLFFPIISLSNGPKILEMAKERFSNVELAAEQTWKLPETMLPHLPVLRRIRDEKRIDFSEKFGMILCNTQIYKCRQG